MDKKIKSIVDNFFDNISTDDVISKLENLGCQFEDIDYLENDPEQQMKK